MFFLFICFFLYFPFKKLLFYIFIGLCSCLFFTLVVIFTYVTKFVHICGTFYIYGDFYIWWSNNHSSCCDNLWMDYSALKKTVVLGPGQWSVVSGPGTYSRPGKLRPTSTYCPTGRLRLGKRPPARWGRDRRARPADPTHPYYKQKPWGVGELLDAEQTVELVWRKINIRADDYQ